MLRITVLMENSPSANKALINEHGLSLILDADGYRIAIMTMPQVSGIS